MIELTPIIDSRKAVNPSESLFFAIKGERNNGHDYISDLYEKGVRNFVVEDDNFNYSAFKDGTFKLVESSIIDLQEYVALKRSKFQIPIIGITGSNGKTIIKEWLSELFFDDEIVVKSPRSYNSQVGVPLSVWQIESFNTIGVFEAGISLVGEMVNLEKVIKPTIGIFTNIGSAHNSGFSTIKQKIEEKLILFKDSDILIYHKSNDELNNVIQASKISTLTWSFVEKADVNYKINKNELLINSLKFKLINSKLKIHFKDKASIENLCHCITLMLYKDYSINQIQQKINHLEPVSMRLEIKKGINNCQLVDDTYNNDLGGLKTALDFLNQHSQKKKKTLILSDISQTGLDESSLYLQLNNLIVENSIDRLIGIGEISTFVNLFKCEKSFYPSTRAFLISDEKFDNESILIKGGRVFHFENIVRKLSAQQHNTVLEVNLNALESNYNYYKSLLKSSTKIMVMVKAHAYGSGSDEIAKILQYNRVDYLAVAYTDEGVELRKKGIKVPIMVMNPSEIDFNNIIDFNLEPEIYSLKLLKAWVSFGEMKNKFIDIHVKIDTGMHRLGFGIDEVDELIRIINKNKICIASVFTHLAGADTSKHNQFTKKQIEIFKKVSSDVENRTMQYFIKHVLNSSGIVSFPKYQMDMVRLGIGIYGFDPVKINNNLSPVTALYSTISQIKIINKGDTIGYNRAGVAKSEISIATINIGYADGVSRQFSNGVGYVSINNKKASIVGNICMDMLMVDVTGIECEEGDRVEIFGNKISINCLAKLIDSIPYEILTSVSQRVKKVYFRD